VIVSSGSENVNRHFESWLARFGIYFYFDATLLLFAPFCCAREEEIEESSKHRFKFKKMSTMID
jgi:hypothetical protein